MARLCQPCPALNFHDLVFNNFNNLARFFPLVAHSEGGEDILVTEIELVARQREDFLKDRDISHEQE